MISLKTSSGISIIQILSGRSNVFLVSGDETNVLVDTSPASKRKDLFTALEKFGISHIEYLLLTHSHYDHCDNAAALKKKFGCKIMIHKAEESNLVTGKMSEPKGTNFFTRFIVTTFATIMRKRMRSVPCKPDIVIEDNYTFSESGLNARIIHTPGHSPGSVSLIADNETAIAGDTIFGVFRGKVFPPYAADADELVKSWKKLLDTGCALFLPSHGNLRSRQQLNKEYNRRKTPVQ
jgi:hydroxyacylglutathione hydrolase